MSDHFPIEFKLKDKDTTEASRCEDILRYTSFFIVCFVTIVVTGKYIFL